MHTAQACNHQWDTRQSSIHWEFVNDYSEFSCTRFGFVSCRRCNILSMMINFVLDHFCKCFRHFFDRFFRSVFMLMMNKIFTMFSRFLRNFHKESVLAVNKFCPLNHNACTAWQKITLLFMFMVWRDVRAIWKWKMPKAMILLFRVEMRACVHLLSFHANNMAQI